MEKSRYTVPSLNEILEKEKEENFKVVSLFAGAGGSSIGYRMSGGKILGINEFVEIAQDTYHLNFPHTHIFKEDVRELTPEKILSTLNLEKGELDILDGSPPCSAFSLQGIREKGWEKEKSYSKNKVQRVDDLFLEYVRILKGLQPKTFVAENVKGLIIGNAIKLLGFPKEFLFYRKQNFSKQQNKNIEYLFDDLEDNYDDLNEIDISYYNSLVKNFDFQNENTNIYMNICKELESCGYKICYRVLNAAEYGVPQNRERLIITGVRNDIAEEYNYQPSLPESLYLNEKEYNTYLNKKVSNSWFKQSKERTKENNILGLRVHQKNLNPSSYQWCTDNEYQKTISVKEAIGHLEHSVPDYVESKNSLRVERTKAKRPEWLTELLIENNIISKEIAEKYPTLIRPFFTSKEWKFIDRIMKEHGNAGLFQSNYNRDFWETPCKTFTTSLRFLHPKINRNFSIEEMCLLMSFPQDYKFIGSNSDRNERIGRAVAPFMMKAISNHLYQNILKRINNDLE
jgi:site-specific DNA-cytosine methylase